MKINKAKSIKTITDWSEYRKPNLKAFHTSWLENGFEVCTDGERILRYNEPISDDLEVREDTIVTKVLRDVSNEEYDCITLPDVKVLKNEIKNAIGRQYKSKRLLYRLGDNSNLAVVNVKLLIDLMEALGTDKIYYNVNKPKNTPLLLKSEVGDAILMPIYNSSDKIGFFVV